MDSPTIGASGPSSTRTEAARARHPGGDGSCRAEVQKRRSNWRGGRFELTCCECPRSPSPLVRIPKPGRATSADSKQAALGVTAAPAESGSAAARASETPAAERQFGTWLAAFNGADRAKLAAFHEAYWPSSKDTPTVDDELAFRNSTGGFEIKKVETSTPTCVEVLVKERDSDQFARATMDVEAAAPNKVSKFDMSSIPRPEGLRPPRWSQEQGVEATPDSSLQPCRGWHAPRRWEGAPALPSSSPGFSR
jgi:hypothetical protein